MKPKSLKQTTKLKPKSLKQSMMIHKSQLPWLLLIWIQGAGILTVFAPTGLDLGYNWSVTVATEQRLFGQGLFVGPYGPLGFLEFAYPSWTFGFALSIFWKLAASSFLFASVSNLLKKKVVKNQLACFFSVAIVTFVNSINMTSTIVVAIYCIRAITLEPWFSRCISREALVDGLILTTVFLIKPLPFLMISMFTLIFYWRNTRVKRNLGIVLSASVLTLLGILMLSGFSLHSFQFWLRGYWEVSKGYTDMSGEEPGRLFEYPLIIILSIYVLYKVHKIRDIFMFLGVCVVIYYSFRYGFNRHDAHSIFSFTIVFFLILSLTIHQKKEKLSWLFFSLVSLLIVSSYSPTEILNFNPRVTNTLNALRTLTDLNFRDTQNLVYKKAAFDNFGLDPKIVEEINGKDVALLPLQEDLSVAGVNNLFPPMSSLFSAYTPWLDSTNADWANSANAPDYMLLQPPTTIDGRYAYWDSPRFWVETLCNYKAIIVTDNWLLLDKREQSKCSYSDKSLVKNGSGNSISMGENFPTDIRVVKLMQDQKLVEKPLRFMFKPIREDTILINKRSFRLVWNNQEYLPVYIPESINLPTKWRMETITDIQTLNSSNFGIYRIGVTE